MSTNTEGAKLITYTHSMQYDILYKTIRSVLGQSMQVMLHKIRPEWPAEFLLEQRGLYLCIPCFLENTSYHPSHSPSILPLTQWSSHVTCSCKCLALSCPGYHPISSPYYTKKESEDQHWGLGYGYHRKGRPKIHHSVSLPWVLISLRCFFKIDPSFLSYHFYAFCSNYCWGRKGMKVKIYVGHMPRIAFQPILCEVREVVQIQASRMLQTQIQFCH